ncbi:olfactory receptor 11H4-like [Mastomys coucha]|uniref:olfactory receptor 11H4-like n=1 Tax=Mastomys coucha TaxID=35658 RepID=UPI0012614CA0|nr:olfactory receptor 11H4-like [Mastomys coucha]
MNRSSTHVTEFVLLGFPGSWKTQIFLFVLFLMFYILTLLGNGAIVCAVRCDSRLHTPMYFLLGNFAFLEIWYVSSTIPNILTNILSKTKAISFSGCFLQFYFAFSTCGSHLVVVSLFYGTVMVMYVSPTYGIPTLMQKILILVYSVMTPLFNPLIYSLRNKDMKLALRNVLLGMRIVKAI